MRGASLVNLTGDDIISATSTFTLVRMSPKEYLFMTITYIQQSTHQPGEVANPACGQLNGEKDVFPVPVSAWELGLARHAFGRPVPRQPAYSPNLGGVHLFISPYTIGSVRSFSGHAIAYRWRSLPKVHRHKASSPQGSFSSGCCLCVPTDQLMCASLFPHPLLVWSGHIKNIKYSTEIYLNACIVCTVQRKNECACKPHDAG